MGSNGKSNSFLLRISAILLLIPAFTQAQLVVTQQSPASLVQNVLIGSGVTVSNITSSGSSTMFGRFDGTNSNIGIGSGMIMSTGRIQDSPGPNDALNAGEDLGVSGNSQIEQLLSGNPPSKDAAVIKFDFICESDKVQFNYVFASEEYPEFVGTEFNDAFAFFIQGPGISGIQNIALIPGTTQPVAINNVNAGSFSSYFVNNNNGSTVQFDGFTKPFVAQANVIPCQTYTITLVITDISDGIYDSAVFLESASFSSPEVTIEQKISYLEGTDQLFENCGYNTIILKRTGPTNEALTIYLENSGSATYGIDYTSFPSSVTFAPGQNQLSFNIQAFGDVINEPGGETVSVIYRDTGCTNIEIKRVDFFIYDPPPLIGVDAGQDVSLICPNLPVLLNAQVNGGVPPYTITWLGQTVGNPITVYPDSSTYYSVQVTDQCGSTVKDSMLANIPNYVKLRLYTSNDTNICRGTKAQLKSLATGGKQPLVYSWVDDSSISLLNRFVTPLVSTQYTVSVKDSCGVQRSRTISVNVDSVKALFSVNYIDQSVIQFNDLSYDEVVQWQWDFGDGSDVSNEKNPIYAYPDTGSFIVELIVKNSIGCKDTISNPLKSYPPFSFYIPNAFTPDGDGLNDSFSGLGEGFVSFEMFIYNRWGEEIFHSEDYSEKWGTGVRGILDRIPIDVYAYKIILTKPTLDRQQFIGRITVVR